MSGSNGGQRGKRELSESEAELWSRIANSTEPLKKDVRIIPAGKSAKKSLEKTTSTKETNPAQKPAAPAPKKPAQTKSTPPLAKFDHKSAKKIARGKDDIDARIDLHGMRQAEAHSALRSFLFSSQAKDKRNVLVITGKGSSKRRREDTDWFGDYEEPGVLKRNLPTWLAEPDMRAIVVSFTEAHARHGGSGAYYVRLRKLGK